MFAYRAYKSECPLSVRVEAGAVAVGVHGTAAVVRAGAAVRVDVRAVLGAECERNGE